MYILNHTTPRAALCIISILLFITLAKAQDNETASCYNAINNGDLVTTFYVEESTPYAAPYACQLSATNVVYNSPTYTLSIGGTADAITCAEMLTIPLVSFGYYECEMQPPGIAGTVTSCMVVSPARTDYESVYIKFFGNDTGRVYVGYYAGGVGYPAGPSVLNFDATAEPHRYGFEWTSGYIKWYVDYKEVSSADGGKPIALLPNRFYANLLTEETGIITDDSSIYTDPTVNRVFSTAGPISVSTVFGNISYTPVIYINCDNTTGIIPGNSGYIPYDPDACDLRTPFTIFADSLAKGWNSANSTVSNFAYTDNVHTGTTAISWDDTPLNSWLYFSTDSPFDASDYYSIEFWIYGNGIFGQQIGVQMLFEGGFRSESVNIAGILTEGIQAYEWSRVVIPFEDFGVFPNITVNVVGFVLSSISSVFGGRIAIDDVLLGYEYPMCSNVTKSIYAEGPGKGFSDYNSWGTYVMKSNLAAHTGNYSIQFSMYGIGGVRLHSTTDYSTNTYGGISFWIDTAALTGWSWTVAMTCATSTATNNVAGAGGLNVYKYYGGVMPQQVGQWIRVVIPFYEFGITSGTLLDGILFELTADPNDYQGILYIDDIEFIEEELPSADHSGASSLGAGLLAVLLIVSTLLM